MQFSEKVKATLWHFIDEMNLNLSEFTVHPGKDFTRKKKWDFPTLLKFMISMESQSLKNELHIFWLHYRLPDECIFQSKKRSNSFRCI